MGWPPLSALAVTLVFASLDASRASRAEDEISDDKDKSVVDDADKDESVVDDAEAFYRNAEVTRPDVLELKCLAFEGSEWSSTCQDHTFIMASARGAKYDLETVEEGASNRGEDGKELDALWKLCRSLKTHNQSNVESSCCPAAPQKCRASVMSAAIRSVGDPWHSVPLPYRKSAAKVMDFIFQERYRGKRFVLSPASRYNPREQPVANACRNYVGRVRSLIKQEGLQLLMRWDPRGYFDVFRSFDSSKYYGPSLKIAILSVLFGIRIKDDAQADDMWDILIDRRSNRALRDGFPDDDDDESINLEWWEEKLDTILSGAYSTLRELEADSMVIQSVAMAKGVRARLMTNRMTLTEISLSIAIGGVAIAATGGAAALPIAVGGLVNGLAMKSVSAVLTEEKRASADTFGQSHKQLKWIEFIREWMELWLEKDIVDSYKTARAKLVIRPEVKEKLICDDQHKPDLSRWAKSFKVARGANASQGLGADVIQLVQKLGLNNNLESDGQAGTCIVKGKTAEVDLKEILIASFVNLVMQDGGCVEPPDLESAYEGSALTFVGKPSEDIVCCAKKMENHRWTVSGKKVKDMCKAHVLDPAEARGIRKCPSGWNRVDDNWAFAGLEPGFKAADVEDTACCGLFSKATVSEFPCRISKCATDRQVLEEQPLGDGEDGEMKNTWLGHCANRGWREDDLLRQTFCNTKKKPHLCMEAKAYSLCKSRRHFCLFYARQKSKEGRLMIRSLQHCLNDMAKLQKNEKGKTK